MKEFIKLPLVLCLVVVICAALISTVYVYTTPILDARTMEEKKTMFNEMYGANLESFEIIEENVNDEIINKYSIKLKDGSTEIGYEVKETGKNGDIVMIITYDDSQTLTNLKYLTISETPGIGSKVEEDAYVSSIQGQNASDPKVDTITGATISSTAVKNAVDITATNVMEEK